MDRSWTIILGGVPRVRILVASSGNEFMLDIARAFQEGFTAAGASCETVTDRLPSADPTDPIQIVVAPHEYFPLFAARLIDDAEILDALGSIHLINVEQPGSPWFELACGYARNARSVFDINRAGVSELRRRGVPAHHAPLGYASSFAAPVCPQTTDRPIDILFMGHASSRREEFFARHADFFSSVNCRIVLADVGRTRQAGTAGYYSGHDRLQLLASSKILLNVHSSERTYFEAHRALLGLANRCLLVTEASRYTEPLENWRDFAMAALDELPSLCQRYLKDIPALSRVAEQGQTTVTTQLTMSTTCRSMLVLLAEVPEQNTVKRPHDSPEATEWSLSLDRDAAMSRLDEARRQRKRGEACWTVTTNPAYERSAMPAISVVVTLYNYAQFIEPCLASVARSEGVVGGVELVVVDDGSTDGSVDKAQAAMAAIDIPALLAAKHLNTGLADARNVGLEIARGDLVFMLDADNWIYPACLATLQAALSEGHCAAAYGMLRRFDDATGEALGLLSMYDWSPAELVRGPYIDAMALFDRQTLLDAGGYSTDLIGHGWFGWEDYDLWLTLAQANLRCRFVPRIVGAYRVHDSSMLTRTNQSTAGLARYFKEKFRPLMGQHLGLDRYFGFPGPSAADALPPAPGGADPNAAALQARLELERRLAEVHASWSWRVTAPLRLALRLITGQP
jgi:GT2 family glycosyltransferase